jgi:hypothetical protein
MPSRVRVLRPRVSTEDGILSTSWSAVSGMESLMCRLEVGLFRPGKDQPLPIQAGRAPDRVAVVWVAPDTDLRPGDHLECVGGPVKGTWEMRTTLDAAVAMNRLHHLEGQVVELPPSVVAGSQ